MAASNKTRGDDGASNTRKLTQMSDDERDIDLLIERMRVHIPKEPYIVSTPSDNPYVLRPDQKNNWQKNTPFDRDEEHLQYMSFFWRDPTHSIFDLRSSAELISTQNDLSCPSKPSSGRISAIGTPLHDQPPKKKISLAAYKTRPKPTSSQELTVEQNDVLRSKVNNDGQSKQEHEERSSIKYNPLSKGVPDTLDAQNPDISVKVLTRPLPLTSQPRKPDNDLDLPTNLPKPLANLKPPTSSLRGGEIQHKDDQHISPILNGSSNSQRTQIQHKNGITDAKFQAKTELHSKTDNSRKPMEPSRNSLPPRLEGAEDVEATLSQISPRLKPLAHSSTFTISKTPSTFRPSILRLTGQDSSFVDLQKAFLMPSSTGRDSMCDVQSDLFRDLDRLHSAFEKSLPSKAVLKLKYRKESAAKIKRILQQPIASQSRMIDTSEHSIDSVSNKRPRDDVPSTSPLQEPAFKRRKSEIRSPHTPRPSTAQSIPFQTPSHLHKFNVATPDRATTSNGVKTKSVAHTPQALVGTPTSGIAELDRSSVQSHTPETSRAGLSYKDWRNETAKLKALGTALKRESQSALRDHKSKTLDTKGYELALAKGMEAILCFMQAFCAEDQWTRNHESWSSLKPLIEEFATNSRKYPHMQGMSFYLASVCYLRVSVCVSYAMLDEERSKDQKLELAKTYGRFAMQAHDRASAAHHLMSRDILAREYPETHTQSEKLPLGPWAKPLLAVRTGCSFLSEWSRKGDLQWTQQLEEGLFRNVPL